VQKKGLGAYKEVSEARKKGLESLVEDKERNEWMRDMSDEKIEKTKEEFNRWIKDGPRSEATNGDRRRIGGLDGADDADDAVMSGT